MAIWHTDDMIYPSELVLSYDGSDGGNVSFIQDAGVGASVNPAYSWDFFGGTADDVPLVLSNVGSITDLETRIFVLVWTLGFSKNLVLSLAKAPLAQLRWYCISSSITSLDDGKLPR